MSVDLKITGTRKTHVPHLALYQQASIPLVKVKCRQSQQHAVGSPFLGNISIYVYRMRAVVTYTDTV